MFSFTKASSVDSMGYKECKVLHIQPLSNTKNGLEFLLTQQKRYLKLADSALAFSVDLPDNYVPDNDFCNKLFENIVLDIDQDTVSKRGSEFDNCMSSFFLNKSMFDENYMENTMATQGVYDVFNDDAEKFDGTQIAIRQNMCTEIKKEVDGNTQRWLRYDFILPLNHGIARTYQPLPANTEIRLKYQRAPASFSIMKIKENVTVLDNPNLASIPFNFTDPVVTIVKPVFRAMYLKSDELDNKMRGYAQYPFEMPFLDYVVRKPVLNDHESDFLIDLTKGKMPSYAVFAICPITRLNGSDTECITKFTRHKLKSFEILLDNVKVEGFPLQLGMKKRYEQCMKDFTRTNDDKHSYAILNASLHCEDDDLRCITGINREFSNIDPPNFPICYTE
ncbi:Oidioi.mRNA.OKI2018_I69.chr2.g5396.t1.cds [Oikopleura dioica]|uniref:Oidioi.mRNA.OKI2018_I69.chr2.g5396.t1.cds n=1 Tax=Oikopleura dioica TaxID=34765 RepID=A0ABN7SZS4_OIKDI|nr:Oidioi.mRNA.OKI2018_I69.chr2.g5396.t1.cds [Oikopleura dioica]